ncbi:YfcE family phosphodiesterase [candidate division WOR-3 bacterium]|nr:YfcE family phosphodiesterase [candidate division WOR-3 bacterium]
MKIGVISDTHKHIANLSSAVLYLKEAGVDKLIHLGDDYGDMDEIGEHDAIRVPGVFCDAYQDKKIRNRLIENFAGWRFLLTHTLSAHANDLPGDAKPEALIEARQIHVVLYGHTHVPEIKQERGIVFFNPGHLKNEDKRGFPPCFGCIELTIDKMLARIYRLRDHSILTESKYHKT